MSEPTYMVVFRGELVEGAELEQVKESLQQLCKLTSEKVEQLFSLSAVVLKKNLSHEIAHGFKTQLERIGVITDIKAMEEARLVAFGAHHEPAAPAAPFSESAVQDEAEGSSYLPVHFNGSAGEYFKIWIVNILFTIVTLGIYSAWAKVRNHRYFYSNTQIGSGSFEYTANPVSILKGRIVAVIFLLAFNYSATAMPLLYGVLSLVFIALLPWLVNRSMAFRNRNTVFRNVRFGFDGRYFDAMLAFVLLPLAGVITIGLLIPYAIYKQKEFLVKGSRYGTSHFEPSFSSGEFYAIAIRAFGLVLLAGVLFALGTLLGPLAFVTGLVGMVIYLLAFAYFTANIGNLLYNSSTLQAHGFESTLKAKELGMLYLTNWLGMALTLGLATPWAKVRLARYRAEHLVLVVHGSLDNFIAAEEEQVNSLGEEIGQAFDFDIGL